MPPSRWLHCQAANSLSDARQRHRPPSKSGTMDDSHLKRHQRCLRRQILPGTAQHWTERSRCKKALQRHHDRKPRLAAHKTTTDAIESVAPPQVITSNAENVANAHLSGRGVFICVGTKKLESNVGSPSRKPVFLETNSFRDNRLLVYTVRTGYGPTTTRCRRTIDLSVSVVALLSEQRR